MDCDIFSVEGEALLKLEVHPLARLVPSSTHISVRDSIESPVVLLDGKILDGRARVREAQLLSISCPCVQVDVLRDDHPALIVARAMTPRTPDTYVRAVVCARLVRCVLLRPAWLERYNLGMVGKLMRRKTLTDMLDACAISLHTYDRASRIIHDPMIESEVLNGSLSLKMAERLIRVPAARRSRFMRLPVEQRETALDNYFARNGGRRAKVQATLDGMN